MVQLEFFVFKISFSSLIPKHPGRAAPESQFAFDIS